MSKNYYEILGVAETATQEEIKKAYRAMQIKWHPDKNPGNNEAIEMTQQLNEAYETLGNAENRKQYDFMRKNGMAGGGFNPNMGSHANANEEEIFKMFFGGMNPFMNMNLNGENVHFFSAGGGHPFFQKGFQKPMPIIKNIDIHLKQSFDGSTIPIEIERWIMGENNIRTTEKETIYINIPKGIDDGEMIILRDKGNVLNENNKGDIKICIRIFNDTEFKRHSLDLILERTISLKEALCGFSFEIKHINGKSYTLNNLKGGSVVAPGYAKIYSGLGMSRGEHTGNMVIKFNVKFPEKMTMEQVDALSNIL
jgi:DnaJ-class molecular chaperone